MSFRPRPGRPNEGKIQNGVREIERKMLELTLREEALDRAGRCNVSWYDGAFRMLCRRGRGHTGDCVPRGTR